MKKQQEILSEPLSKKPSEQQVQEEIKKILDEQLEEKRFIRTNLSSTTTAKTSRKK